MIQSWHMGSSICFGPLSFALLRWNTGHIWNLLVPMETVLPLLLMVAARAKLAVWGFVLLFSHSQPCGFLSDLCLCICRAVGNGVLYYLLEACVLKATLCSRFVCSDVKLVPRVNRFLVLSPPPHTPTLSCIFNLFSCWWLFKLF